jgi:hypothetical protein
MVQGRTNNHLTFVMVDATDFASRESAMSAAVKLKVYGTLEGATGVNFVSSGTGSLTNDVVHVGASANGVYHIALAKADLSDASAAWYDEYIIILSATGAAYETFILEGVRTDTSYLSAAISDVLSAVTQINSRVLLTQSAASDAASAAQQANSRVLLNQSRISDVQSYLIAMSDVLSDLYSDFQSRVPKLVATNSQLSDLHSDLKSYLAVMSGVQSDVYSLLSDANSDLASKIGAITATVGASDLSDIASAVWANTIGARVDSRLKLTQSNVSDIASYLALMSDVLSDFYSDFQSRVPKRVATDSQLSDMASDLKSAIAAITATVGASDISDIASAVWANTIGARVDSRLKLVQSTVSDVQSYLAVMSGVQSDIASLLNAGVTTTTADKQAAADEFLNRDLATGGSGNTRRVQQALRGLRNKTRISGGVLTIYAEDDTTAAWSAATSTAAGDPLVSIDP